MAPLSQSASVHAGPVEPSDSHPEVETIDVLSRGLGESDEREVAVLTGAVSDAELIERGRKVDTQRITDDTVRIVVAARGFFLRATPVLAATLKLSPDVLRVVAWSALQGQRAYAALNVRKAARRTRKNSRVVAHAGVLRDSRVERDQLAGAIRSVAVGDAEQLAAVDAAMSPATSGEGETGPGRALASLVTIGRAYVQSKDPGVVARCKAWSLTAAWLDQCASLSTRALAAERAANAPAAVETDEQALVDRWDGVNLVLLERVVRAFALARASNPAVPRMPVTSLRTVIGTHKRPRADARGRTPDGPPTPPT